MTANPFRRGRLFWARIPNPSGDGVQRSLGTSEPRVAREIAAFLRLLSRQRAKFGWLLTELAAGRIAVSAAFQAYSEDRLTQFLADRAAVASDMDLLPLVDTWVEEMARTGRPAERQQRKYAQHVRRLIVPGFSRSRLTRQVIRDWLATIKGQSNRHRASLSAFCEYLIFAGLIEANPVHAVPAKRESRPRERFLSPADALALVRALPAPHRALHALLIASGAELGPALALHRRDLDLNARTVHIAGTKTAHRDRTCTIYDRWREVWKEVEKHATSLLPDAPLFPDLKEHAIRDAFATALKVRKVENYRVHDHRHTWAVQAVRDGISLVTVGHQLGHRDATMAVKCYARYVPTQADFPKSKADSATVSTTVKRGST